MNNHARIIVVDRSSWESEFEPRRRFCLLSVRRPGTRLVQGKCEWAMLSRLDLMLHEWESEREPFPCPPVKLQARQAMKLVDWLQRMLSTLRYGDTDFVIQSEYASPQVSAIAGVVANTLGWPIVGEVSISPHRDTQVMLEMAFAAASALSGSSDSMFTESDPSSQTSKIAWLGHLFHIVNIQFVVLADQTPFKVDDHGTAKRAKKRLKARFGDSQLSSRDNEVLDFITHVMLLRGTHLSPCLPKLEPELDLERSCSNSMLIADSALLPKSIENTDRRWTIHYYYKPGEINIEFKSAMLRRGAWLIDSPTSAGRLLSISWRPNPCIETLHHRLRYPKAAAQR